MRVKITEEHPAGGLNSTEEVFRVFIFILEKKKYRIQVGGLLRAFDSGCNRSPNECRNRMTSGFLRLYAVYESYGNEVDMHLIYTFETSLSSLWHVGCPSWRSLELHLLQRGSIYYIVRLEPLMIL